MSWCLDEKDTLIQLTKKTFVYNGKNQPVKLKVNCSLPSAFIEGKDYTISYPTGNKTVGTHKAVIKCKGNYSESGTYTFTIVPKGTSIKKLKAGKKSFTVTWKAQKVQTSGYEIQYALNSKFTKSRKTVRVNKPATTKKTIKKLKAKKKYYVRIRTYKTVGGKRYYSAWSKTKTIKTKK